MLSRNTVSHPLGRQRIEVVPLGLEIHSLVVYRRLHVYLTRLVFFHGGIFGRLLGLVQTEGVDRLQVLVQHLPRLFCLLDRALGFLLVTDGQRQGLYPLLELVLRVHDDRRVRQDRGEANALRLGRLVGPMVAWLVLIPRDHSIDARAVGRLCSGPWLLALDRA